ncbi:MAG: lysophospholipase L1-like esterase [Planctomycetaceae bacterium]|jgi:lysophospholipase L1-like esterase
MNDVRLLILGDSITAGCVETGVPPQNSYPSLLRDAFNRESPDVTVIVSALHGVYVDYVLRRFDRMVLRHQPDNVLIFLGANDAGATETRPAISPDQFAADLVSLVSRCRENDISPVIASPIPCAMDRCLHPMNQYADASRDTARRCKAGFVDLFQCVRTIWRSRPTSGRPASKPTWQYGDCENAGHCAESADRPFRVQRLVNPATVVHVFASTNSPTGGSCCVSVVGWSG